MPTKHRSLPWLIFLFIVPAVLLAAGLYWGPRHLGMEAKKKPLLRENSVGIDQASKTRMVESYGRMPMYFIENRGQVDKQVKYYARGPGHTLFFTKEGLVMTLVRPGEVARDQVARGQESETDEWTPPNPEKVLQGFSRRLQGLLTPLLPLSPLKTLSEKLAKIERREPFAGKRERIDRSRDLQKPVPVTASVVRMEPVGMRKQVKIKALERQECKVNYFIGNDPKKWRTAIPTYAAVVYQEAYKGIDLKFYGNGRQMEYDIVVKPGADPGQVRFQYAGVERLEITPTGDLALKLPDGGELIQKKPYVYQVIAGQQVVRDGKFKISKHNAQFIYNFNIAAYDKKYPLVIDPVLVYSTYLGGSGAFPNGVDSGDAIAVDNDGNAYVTGWTLSLDFPTHNPLYPTKKGYSGYRDAFVTKISSSGSGMIYSTYLGGTYSDSGAGIAVDEAGNAYITGNASEGFPITCASLPSGNGYSSDAFVTKISSDGSMLLYSAFLGGQDIDYGNGIAIDKDGNVYVVGTTRTANITSNPLRPHGGDWDVFVAKISPDCTGLKYFTYLGGTKRDWGGGIAVDSQGNAYVTGHTESNNFPIQNPLLICTNLMGTRNAFVTKINSSGTGLIYSTYLGGSNRDEGNGIAVDINGNAYVTGAAYSADFPILNPLPCCATKKGSGDAFITKISPTGTALVFSTFLGGSAHDKGMGIAVDSAGNAYVTGMTISSDFPLKNSLYAFQGNYDAFVSKINPVGTDLIYSTYLGGSFNDQGNAIAVGMIGHAYITGLTYSGDFPITNPLPGGSQLQGDYDAFVTKISDRTTPYLSFGPIPSPQNVGAPFEVKITAWTADGTADNGFNGTVALTCQTLLSQWITLTNGAWTGQVTLGGGGAGLVLKAAGSGRYGESKPFDTSGTYTGSLGGRVVDNGNPPQALAGATVYLALTAGDSQNAVQAQTDAQGFYQFPSVASRTYYLWANQGGDTSNVFNQIFVPSGMCKVAPDLQVVKQRSSYNRIPVILVPGIMGSTTKKFHVSPFPRLPADWADPEDLQLHDPLGKAGWRDLKDILTNQEDKGLKEGHTLFDCPYDWRVHLDTAVQWYLKKTIDKAKRESGSPKVNVIAHSMGGLLVRAYIQGPLYEGDIERFIMVGTPNQGSANVYYLWEGGDPKEVDDRLEPYYQGMLNFYYNTTRLQMLDTGWLSPLIVTGPLGYFASFTPSNIIQFVHTMIPSVRQLLPTYDFLRNQDNRLAGINTVDNVNNFLLKLNSDANKDRMGKADDPNPSKVKTWMYYGGSEETIGEVYVSPEAPFWFGKSPFYADGRPYRAPKMFLGDGTVTTVSAAFPVADGWATGKAKVGSHSSLIKTYAQEIANDLYGTGSFLARAPLADRSLLAVGTVYVNYKGRLQPYLTGPQGGKVGINPANGLMENSISEAKLLSDADMGSISIDNPGNGVYILDLKGVAACDYHLTLGYMDNEQSIFKEYWGYNNGSTTRITFQVNSGLPGVISYTPTPAAPGNLQANAVNVNGLMTSLTWTPSTDPQVVAYKVYAKGANDQTFTLLGTTTGNSFLTNLPWAATAGISPMTFVVVAVRADGTESFFSNQVLNNDRDHDGLSDADEIKYGTNPDKADTDGDGFTDGQEFLGGTNPLDPKSRPLTPGKGLVAILQLLLFD